MARNESDREDLLADATALVQRIELRLADLPETIVAGFRENGCASIFFGPDPVYHFNAANELRRAFFENVLYKAEDGALVSLTRKRIPGQVQLERRKLDGDSTCDFLGRLEARLDVLRRALEGQSIAIVGQSPPNAAVLDRVQSWLGAMPLPVRIARSPRVAGGHDRKLNSG